MLIFVSNNRKIFRSCIRIEILFVTFKPMEAEFDKELSIPMYYGMIDEEVQYVIDKVNKFRDLEI